MVALLADGPYLEDKTVVAITLNMAHN